MGVLVAFHEDQALWIPVACGAAEELIQYFSPVTP
jgi:hypothetical protein